MSGFLGINVPVNDSLLCGEKSKLDVSQQLCYQVLSPPSRARFPSRVAEEQEHGFSSRLLCIDYCKQSRSHPATRFARFQPCKMPHRDKYQVRNWIVKVAQKHRYRQALETPSVKYLHVVDEHIIA